MQTQRIPSFANKTREGMGRWFSEMALRDLLFHPDESPYSIIRISTGEPMFTQDECAKLAAILDEMHDMFGDGVCDVAYPIFMRAAGFPPEG